MSVLHQFISLFRRKRSLSDIELRIAAEEAVIRDARDLLAIPDIHPMKAYWSREAIRGATQRLYPLRRVHAAEVRETELRAMARISPTRDRAAHPQDPFAQRIG